jgi:hypothetical protein
MVLVFLVAVGFFFISVKRSLFYLSFWAITMTFIALFLLFQASGYVKMEQIKEAEYEKSIQVERM